MSDPKRELLRHSVATVAYRGHKAVADAPEDFASFRGGPSSRTAAEILAHIGDLFEWALSLARGKQAWSDSVPLPWSDEIARFSDTLAAFDAQLASETPLAVSCERLMQGPVADSLTHVGQIALLRRLAGAPIRGENYSIADVVAGRVSRQQTPPRRAFD